MHHDGHSTTWLAAAAMLVVALVAAPAQAQVQAPTRFGAHAGIWEDGSNPLVGLELLTPISENWFFNPSFDFVSADHANLYILSADAHFDLDVARPTLLWVGGGAALIIRDSDWPHGSGTDTDLGLDVLAGAGFTTASGLIPYVQAKAVLADDSSAVLTLGLRF